MKQLANFVPHSGANLPQEMYSSSYLQRNNNNLHLLLLKGLKQCNLKKMLFCSNMQNASPAMNYGQSGQAMSLAEAQIRGLVSNTTRQTLDNSFLHDFMPTMTTPNFAGNLTSGIHPPPASSTKEDDRNPPQ